ncbi:MAG: response regulator transcription factor [Oleispira sp.]|nr:response regulator transcription factor [Oleispira sp.]MBL4880722.1 response regulator transcription factor [Oleispira sp.]
MKILHLEDHTLFAESFSALLTSLRSDFQIISASTTRAALEILSEHEDIDLIIIDLNVPGLHGLTFIDGLNQRNLYIPFILLSASDDLKKIRLALRNGASGFIPKTNSAKQILAAIDQVMGGSVVISAELKKQLKILDEKEPVGSVSSEIARRYQLSERQLDVLNLIQKGCSNQEVAQVLNISVNTVKVHMRVLCEAFEAKNRNDCVSYAEKIGLLI